MISVSVVLLFFVVDIKGVQTGQKFKGPVRKREEGKRESGEDDATCHISEQSKDSIPDKASDVEDDGPKQTEIEHHSRSTAASSSRHETLKWKRKT